MTHGVLKIISRSKTYGNRVIWLHTFHTGQWIPDAVKEAVKLLASHYRWVVEEKPRTKESLRDSLLAMNGYERLDYVNGVAALVIAAKPFLLEPVTPGSKKDLPKWSGMDTPYVLTIADGKWVLKGEDGNVLWDVNPHDEMDKHLLGEV